MSPTVGELLKHKEALITVFSVVGATLFYFFYRLYRGRKYHLKELKALGLYQDNTKDVMNEKTGLRERRVSSKIKVYWKRRLYRKSNPTMYGLFKIYRYKRILSIRR